MAMYYHPAHGAASASNLFLDIDVVRASHQLKNGPLPDQNPLDQERCRLNGYSIYHPPSLYELAPKSQTPYPFESLAYTNDIRLVPWCILSRICISDR